MDDSFFDYEPDDDDDQDSNLNTDAYRSLPVYIKAEELVKIVHTLFEVIDPEKDVLEIRAQMMEHAFIIPAKIAGAEGGDLYSIRFDNATIIKLAARDLQACTSLLKHEKLCDEKYIKMLRDEIGSFRILFLQWVASFDKENDLEDEWDIKGL
jgi:hypothetical protein